MASYRCYRVDMMGHIISVELFEAFDDTAASVQARKFAKDERWDSVQLWQLGRRIAPLT